MMTREQVIEQLELTDDVVYPGRFSVYAQKIAQHDADQRQRIAQLEKRVAIRWTSDKPTVPGWYWWRFDKEHDPECTYVGEWRIKTQKEWIGQWSSTPIEEPKEA